VSVGSVPPEQSCAPCPRAEQGIQALRVGIDERARQVAPHEEVVGVEDDSRRESRANLDDPFGAVQAKYAVKCEGRAYAEEGILRVVTKAFLAVSIEWLILVQLAELSDELELFVFAKIDRGKGIMDIEDRPLSLPDLLQVRNG
jgi:hypothetical protein